MKRIGIVANVSKAECLPMARSIVEALTRRGLEVVFEPKESAAAVFPDGPPPQNGQFAESEMVLSLGGDGTFLKSVRLVGEHDVPILGVNLGRLGFLAEFSAQDFVPSLDRILAGDYRIDERMALTATLIREGTAIRTERALNDVVVHVAGVSRLAVLETLIDNEYLTTYEADGLIVATPTGSTAYSLSAGGPIMDPSIAAIIITPICPHALSNRPIVVPSRRVVTVTPRYIPEGVTVTVDGQTVVEMFCGDALTVAASKKSVKLITTDEASYFEILRSKLGWGGSKEL